MIRFSFSKWPLLGHFFPPLGHFWLPTFLLFSICLMDAHSCKAREVPFSSWRHTLPLRPLVHTLSLILVKSLYTNRSQFACCDSISYMIFAYNLLLFPVTCTNIFMDWNRLEATPVYLLPSLMLCSLPPSPPTSTGTWSPHSPTDLLCLPFALLPSTGVFEQPVLFGWSTIPAPICFLIFQIYKQVLLLQGKLYWRSWQVPPLRLAPFMALALAGISHMGLFD